MNSSEATQAPLETTDLILINRLRQDLEAASRELGKLKDRHLEQAVKYSRALEEQGKASTRERDLLRQVGRLATPGAKQCSNTTFAGKSSDKS